MRSLRCLMIPFGIMVFAGAVVIAVAAPPALACSCQPWTPEDLTDGQIEAAFAGTIIAGPDDAEGSEFGGTVRWTASVDSVHAGALPPTLRFRTSSGGSAACGLDLTVDERIRITMRRNDGEWVSGGCSQLTTAELNLIGPARAPDRSEGSPPTTPEKTPASPLASNSGTGANPAGGIVTIVVVVITVALVLLPALWALARTTRRRREDPPDLES